MNKKLLLTITVLASIAVFAGCSSTQNGDSSLTDVTDSGTISPLQELSYDWKDIDIAGGDVSREFSFENSGEDDLILKGAATSCMCTTATFTLPNGENSPDFGMHGNQEWAYAIKPGESFSVNVVFDPMAHGPNAVGPIQRSVYILSSSLPNGNYAVSVPDSQDMVTEVKVSGDVLYSEEFKEKNAQTGFIFDETEHDFGVIKQSGGIVSYDFPFTYQGGLPVSITGTPSSCACTEGEISAEEFQPGESGVLTVNFDPNLHAEPEGKFFKTVSILTDPKLEQSVDVKVWVEIDLDLGPEAFKLQDDHDDEHANGQAFHNISPQELQHDLENKDFFLVDVHIPEQEHIEKTDAFIAYNEVEANLDQLPQDKNEKIVVYCRSGSMSLEASQKLTDLGYKNVYNLEGGRNAYIELTQ
jgi:rhodanese-related sulfurtransferase